MDKNLSISNKDYIKSSLDNIKINSDINITKINELQASLDKASKALIIPILSIQHKLKATMIQYITNYTEIKSKAIEALNHINQLNDVNEKINMSLSNIQLKQASMDKHDKLINLYEAVSNNLSLFDDLFKTSQYDKLVSSFDNLVTDEELCEKNDDLNQMEKEIKLKKIKKKKKKLTTATSSKKDNKTQGSARKSKQNNKDKNKDNEDNDDNNNNNDSNNNDDNTKSNKKKGKADIELLEIIQKEYPTSAYIQKISRTFLRRRLFKKVIYLHTFNFNTTTHNITEERIRSSGDSTIYKYGRFTFDFINTLGAKQYNQAITFIEENLKHSFVQSDSNYKSVIIAGKITMMLNDLLDKVFRTNDLYKDYHVNSVKIEFYEFYEELVSEFNPKEKNVRINCDEKNLKQLNEDWKGLLTVREFVENHRKNLS